MRRLPGTIGPTGAASIAGRHALQAIGRRYVGDLVFGANDGLITTFAVVAGVVGAALAARVVLILGVANLLADGFSMGASNYLARRSTGAGRDAAAPAAGEGSPVRHGVATVVAFVTAGAVPLAAYLLPLPAGIRLPTATALTLLTLFAVGAGRTLVTGRGWWRGGLEMLLVGALAAAAAYAIGAVVAELTGGRMS
jgi:VIT1/CCC1 family predicted Fe2+/Mn2+ transporter